MQKYVIGECPICNHDLKVTRLKCNHCQTEISGDFQLSKFNYLSKDHLYFIELFIKNKGSIKKLEKELNVSYPTVKKLMKEVTESLGYKMDEDEEPDEKGPDRDAILEKLAKGEITSDEALKMLGE